ncbi:MAG: hypothetical protein IJI36_17950 [Kiritimatiellae bacterium]|nr:hypothetical protein [Kiritimatiellia bacterium]
MHNQCERQESTKKQRPKVAGNNLRTLSAADGKSFAEQGNDKEYRICCWKSSAEEPCGEPQQQSSNLPKRRKK